MLSDLKFHLLRSNNILCSHPCLFLTEEPRETEIRNFRDHLTIQQYILRFKIHMDNVNAV